MKVYYNKAQTKETEMQLGNIATQETHGKENTDKNTLAGRRHAYLYTKRVIRGMGNRRVMAHSWT